MLFLPVLSVPSDRVRPSDRGCPGHRSGTDSYRVRPDLARSRTAPTNAWASGGGYARRGDLAVGARAGQVRRCFGAVGGGEVPRRPDRRGDGWDGDRGWGAGRGSMAVGG